MTGSLYVIGVGPGDPELLTLKAVRILREVPCICVPKGRGEGSSLALSIAEKAVSLEDKEIIEAYFPMRKTKKIKNQEWARGGNKISPTLCELDTRWHETVEMILSRLNKGVNVAFITLGDPTIYSTFFYLYDRLLELNPDLSIEIIPGVSSINAAASRAKISLGLADEKIAILPANYVTELKEILKDFDTVVLMKVHKDFNKIISSLHDIDLLSNATYISRVGMEDERILRNLLEVKEQDLNYFSMVIVKRWAG